MFAPIICADTADGLVAIRHPHPTHASTLSAGLRVGVQIHVAAAHRVAVAVRHGSSAYDLRLADVFVQCPLVQSSATRHALPASHLGQVPPPQSMSVSFPFSIWSMHWPVWQMLLTQL